MSTAKRLAFIAAGYAISVGVGIAAVALNELLMPVDASQGSPGMVAFGDMVLFFVVTGFFGLAPTWFLLRLAVEKVPRTTVAIELLVAATGPASWLTMMYLARRGAEPPAVVGQLLALLIPFGAIPRIVLGPVLLVIEAVTFLLVGGRAMRGLLVAAMLMDLVPIGIFVLRFLLSPRY
jgi:hypothetical protein